MSYQQYMNMGFGAPHAGNPYMMGFQHGMPRQMQNQAAAAAAQNQYIANHRAPAMNMAAHPMAQNWNPATAAAMNVGAAAAAAKRKPGNDPNRPKRPTSAYFYFVQLEREEAAKRGEKITRVAEWTKAISVKWRELTAEQKETFQKMAANDKQRYMQQMAIYTGKDANRPKRPQSAYFLWLADFRARMKDKFVENKDILRAAGEEWRRLTTEAKAPYEQKAEEERRKYEVAMKEYNMSGGAKRPRVESSAASASGSAADAYNNDAGVMSTQSSAQSLPAAHMQAPMSDLPAAAGAAPTQSLPEVQTVLPSAGGQSQSAIVGPASTTSSVAAAPARDGLLSVSQQMALAASGDANKMNEKDSDLSSDDSGDDDDDDDDDDSE